MTTTTYMPATLAGRSKAGSRVHFLNMPFDTFDQSAVLKTLNAARPGDPYRYIVTPNVDHVIRAAREPALLASYEAAYLSVCDSTPIVKLARILRMDLPLVTGSDMTVRLFQSVLRSGDQVTLIAASDDLVTGLEHAFPNVRFRSLVPPAGVARDPSLVDRCAEFVAATQPRFTLLAIGSPASEMIAHRLGRDNRATGTALCIGAGIEFLLQKKKRAPMWMRRTGLEWLHRLASEPRRLWRRYVYAVIPLARLFADELATRTRSHG